MQFRERRQVIQLIRTVYDPVIKRGRSEMIGRLDKDAPALDDGLRAICTPDELVEIEDFLTARSALMSAETVRESAHSLAGHMRRAEAYFRAEDTDQAALLAAEIFTAWDDLKKAMHKAGFRKKGPPKQGRSP